MAVTRCSWTPVEDNVARVSVHRVRAKGMLSNSPNERPKTPEREVKEGMRVRAFAYVVSGALFISCLFVADQGYSRGSALDLDAITRMRILYTAGSDLSNEQRCAAITKIIGHESQQKTLGRLFGPPSVWGLVDSFEDEVYPCGLWITYGKKGTIIRARILTLVPVD